MSKGSVVSGTSRTSGGASVTERRLKESMERLLAETPKSPPPAEYRPRGRSAPPPPMTLSEFYDARFEVVKSPKWREQLIDRPAHKRNSDADVSEIVLALEEGPLTTMLAFDGKPAVCYMADVTSGVWSKTEGPKYRSASDAVLQMTERLDAYVIEPVKAMIRRQHTALKTKLAEGSAAPLELERLQAERVECEEHLREVVVLFERLRKLSHQQAVLECIVTKRMVATRDEGVFEDVLDVAKDCIAFEDGVFCFGEARLLTGAAARAKYLTMTVGYRFEELREAVLEEEEEASDDACAWNKLPTAMNSAFASASWRAYDEFVERIYSSTPGVRRWLVDVMASSALAEVRQMIVFHYRKAGSNGKSTMFELVRYAFGDLHEACQSVLLSESKRTASGGANEDLVSVKGKRIVQMTEVCSKDKLSASAVKEATGGDQQSARGLYQKKQKFVCFALMHVLCNTVPVFNDEDGGTTRRIRCIEYGSTFVDAGDQHLDKYRGQPHVYEKVHNLTALFEKKWKFYLMFEVATAAVLRVRARDQPSAAEQLPRAPDSVLAATRRLVERESTATTFIAGHLERTDARSDIVTLNDLYAAYERMCRDDGNKSAKPKGIFKEDVLASLGPCAKILRGERNLWRGWRLVSKDADADDDDGLAE